MTNVVRRGLIAGGAALLGLGGAAYAFRNQAIQYLLNLNDNSKFARTSPSFEDGDACIVSASAIEGPYLIDEDLERSDVREGRPGMPVALKLKVVDATGCAPISGARVDLWHYDARGVYSGHTSADPDNFDPMFLVRGPAHIGPSDDSRFLRGRQTTDAAGMVGFTTIFPGWYAPRTPHMHVRVVIGSREAVTMQLYFADEIIAAVQSREPYASRGPSPYTNRNDRLIAEAEGAPGGWPKTTTTADGLAATLTIGVRRLA